VKKSTKRVLITGGTGYIGSHVAKYLKLQDYHVAVVDNIRRRHTEKYADHLIINDFASEESIAYAKTVDAIVHCAGTSLVGPSVQKPAIYYNNNVAKSIAFFNSFVLKHKKPAVVFSSSASVYGNSGFPTISETDPTCPNNPYGWSKLAVDQMLQDYVTAYNLKAISLRYFNACGADVDSELGQEPNATHIVARLLEAKLNNTQFTLYGTDFQTDDGTCVRDYVHVWDLAKAHYLAIEYLLAGGESMPMNLGTNVGISNREMLGAAEKHVGSIEVVYGDRRDGDPARLIAHTDRASKLLHWTPEFSDVDTIIKTAWKWYTK